MSFLVNGSSNRRPISRLIAKSVLSGLVTAWRLAGWPISRSPSLVKATIDGVVRAPSAFSMTLGLPPSITAMHELVVPRSIPITLAIITPLTYQLLDAALLASRKWRGRSAARLLPGYRIALAWHKRPGGLEKSPQARGECQ